MNGRSRSGDPYIAARTKKYQIDLPLPSKALFVASCYAPLQRTWFCPTAPMIFVAERKRLAARRSAITRYPSMSVDRRQSAQTREDV
jgi:hypothetical protein